MDIDNIETIDTIDTDIQYCFGISENEEKKIPVVEAQGPVETSAHVVLNSWLANDDSMMEGIEDICACCWGHRRGWECLNDRHVGGELVIRR